MHLKKTVEKFQEISTDFATGVDTQFEDWERARDDLLAQPELLPKIPSWVASCRTGSAYWAFIKDTPTYRERRELISTSLAPLFSLIDLGSTAPVALSIDALVQVTSSVAVSDSWTRIQSRRNSDPEGAITAARSLLETTCKYILDKRTVSYSDSDDLPQLYKHVAKTLCLSPNGETEQVFKKILSGCISTVTGVAEMRNKFGDAHGKSIKSAALVETRYADLAINLCGAMSSFLIATHEALGSGRKRAG